MEDADFCLPPFVLSTEFKTVNEIVFFIRQCFDCFFAGAVAVPNRELNAKDAHAFRECTSNSSGLLFLRIEAREINPQMHLDSRMHPIMILLSLCQQAQFCGSMKKIFQRVRRLTT